MNPAPSFTLPSTLMTISLLEMGQLAARPDRSGARTIVRSAFDRFQRPCHEMAAPLVEATRPGSEPYRKPAYFLLLRVLVPPWSLPGPEPPWPEASGLTIPPLLMPSWLTPVVPLLIVPLSVLVMPGFCMLSDCAAGPVWVWAKAEPHMRPRAAVAMTSFFISNSWLVVWANGSAETVFLKQGVPGCKNSHLRASRDRFRLKPSRPQAAGRRGPSGA